MLLDLMFDSSILQSCIIDFNFCLLNMRLWECIEQATIFGNTKNIVSDFNFLIQRSRFWHLLNIGKLSIRQRLIVRRITTAASYLLLTDLITFFPPPSTLLQNTVCLFYFIPSLIGFVVSDLKFKICGVQTTLQWLTLKI